MQALWLKDQTLDYRQAVPEPIPAQGEALVRIRLAGICATDLEMVRGYYPFQGIPGHEFVGEVVTAPTGNENWIGRRVVGEINLTCNECIHCRSGRASHCSRRTVLGISGHNGVFADYTTLPLQNLHQVPDSISDEAAVFTEPLAAALEIQQQVSVHPNDRVLVIGAGRLGQLVAQTLALTGCGLEVAARYQRQKELLRKCHIPTIDSQNLRPGEYDLVVEATGSSDGFSLARQAVRPRGCIVLKSTYKGDLTTNFSSLVVEEITLVGSRCGPFAPALRLLEAKNVDPTPLIEARYPLAQSIPAFQHAGQSGALKILLE